MHDCPNRLCHAMLRQMPKHHPKALIGPASRICAKNNLGKSHSASSPMIAPKFCARPRLFCAPSPVRRHFSNDRRGDCLAPRDLGELGLKLARGYQAIKLEYWLTTGGLGPD
jgi:hypothetical protein